MEYRQRGDTLIEVMMAIVILSIVIVGAITMMSRGLGAAQIAVEHTQVRNQINTQTELLRFLRDGYLQDPKSQAGLEWVKLFNPALLYADAAQSTYSGTCGVTASKRGFYLSQSGSSVQLNTYDPGLKPDTSAFAGRGLWVEATRSPSGISPAYVDFQLRACWAGLGSSAEQQTVTAVRLYDPAN
jgi:prepilin-type N-terminal cleavage/methylation domain-containing protein